MSVLGQLVKGAGITLGGRLHFSVYVNFLKVTMAIVCRSFVVSDTCYYTTFNLSWSNCNSANLLHPTQGYLSAQPFALTHYSKLSAERML
jgi:hypothetical protein